jgi:hypothetical protein
MGAGGQRDFPVAGNCGIPATAKAYSLNFTAVPTTTEGALITWPTGQARPNASTLNDYVANTTVANAAIVPAGTNGAISVWVLDQTDLIVDVNGYFAPPGAGGLKFYPIPPCRVADTRGGTGFSGSFGPPRVAVGSPRTYAVASSACGAPSTAGAYSLNFTVVPPWPPGYLGYLTTWPAGQVEPVVSTLNSYNGWVTANAAIVPTGPGGSIVVDVHDTTDVLFDINGYFAQ